MFLKRFENRDSLKSDAITKPENTRDFTIIKKIGSGAFGVIWSVKMKDGRILAVKKVHQDPKYINRELAIFKEVNHPNCLTLVESKQVFEDGQEYLELFTELFPIDLHLYPSILQIFSSHKNLLHLF